MELNSNLIGIQGVLVNCLKKIGEFTRINYRGGNGDKIVHVLTEIEIYLNSKGFIKEHQSRSEYRKELNELVLFLALNTAFKKPLNLDEYSHLINIIPQLSKCLLANICFELDLIPQYGYLIENLSCEVTEELLDQAIECLRKEKPEKHLKNACALLTSVVNKLIKIEISYKTEDAVEDIVRVVNIILQNLLCLSRDDMETMSKNAIYLHMGLTLLEFFKLLNLIDENKAALKSLLKYLLLTTSSLIKCVSLNVFCAWAEVDYGDQTLQVVITSNAYAIVEKFKSFEAASELVSMLNNIAIKPKSLSEIIAEANIETIIKKVNENDQNQDLWFRALISTPLFLDTRIIDCIDKWYKLCDASSFRTLLSYSSMERRLIINIGLNLPLNDLKKVLMEQMLSTPLFRQDNIQDQLTLFFNHVQSEYSDNDLKRVLLFIFLNGRLFFEHFFTSAVMDCTNMRPIFKLTKDMDSIKGIALEILSKVLEPDIKKITNFVKIFEIILDTGFFTWDLLVSEIFLKLLEVNRSDGRLKTFCAWLHILKHFEDLFCEMPREIELINYLLKTLSEFRCKSFLQFNSLNNDIAKCCADCILIRSRKIKRDGSKHLDFLSLGSDLADPWSKYYRDCFVSPEEASLLDCLLPNFTLDFYRGDRSDPNFSRLLKVLPESVSSEWTILLNEIQNKCGFVVTLEALTEILILFCDITETKTNVNEGEDTLILPLKLLIQNYGRFLSLDSKPSSEKIEGINNVLRLMIYMPESLKSTEAMSLINLLPIETLRALSHEKEFVARIVLIDNNMVSRAFAELVL